MARRSIQNALTGQPLMAADPSVIARKEELIQEAQVTLKAISKLDSHKKTDPFLDAETLTKAVQVGILDAPHLMNNPFALGKVRTRIINGMCLAVDEHNRDLREEQRLAAYL
jgi:hypothetical protein